MIRLLTVLLLTTWMGAASTAQACERHLNGHQNSSDTGIETQRQ
ncbi:MAG: hypothetical protein ACOVNL_07920 [Prochlorococcaceae cyanobacterium]|jgi:hypothetical protein